MLQDILGGQAGWCHPANNLYYADRPGTRCVEALAGINADNETAAMTHSRRPEGAVLAWVDGPGCYTYPMFDEIRRDILVLPEGAGLRKHEPKAPAGIYGTQNIYDPHVRLGSVYYDERILSSYLYYELPFGRESSLAVDVNPVSTKYRKLADFRDISAHTGNA